MTATQICCLGETIGCKRSQTIRRVYSGNIGLMLSLPPFPGHVVLSKSLTKLSRAYHIDGETQNCLVHVGANNSGVVCALAGSVTRRVDPRIVCGRPAGSRTRLEQLSPELFAPDCTRVYSEPVGLTRNVPGTAQAVYGYRAIPCAVPGTYALAPDLNCTLF